MGDDPVWGTLFGLADDVQLIDNRFCDVANPINMQPHRIERWGMGTLKILDWCKEFDCPVPDWREQAASVYATFRPAEWFEQQLSGLICCVTAKTDVGRSPEALPPQGRGIQPGGWWVSS